MVKNHIANNCHVNPCFLMTHFISYLFYLSCDVSVKSQNPKQINLLGYYMAVSLQWTCSVRNYKCLLFTKRKHNRHFFLVIYQTKNMPHAGPLSLSFFPDLLFSVICVIFLALPTPFTLVSTERRIQLFIFCFDTKRQNKSEWVKVRMHAICFFKQFPLKFKTLKCSNVSSFT